MKANWVKRLAFIYETAIKVARRTDAPTDEIEEDQKKPQEEPADPQEQEKKNWKEALKSLSTFSKRKEWLLSNGFSILGQGWGRVVFTDGGDSVLKVAQDFKGVGQNQIEHNFSGTSSIFPKIISYDPKFSWIESEKGTPVSLEDLGIPPQSIKYIYGHYLDDAPTKDLKAFLTKRLEIEKKFENQDSKPKSKRDRERRPPPTSLILPLLSNEEALTFIQEVFNSGMAPLELIQKGNIGRDSTGKLVMLDSGTKRGVSISMPFVPRALQPDAPKTREWWSGDPDPIYFNEEGDEIESP